MLPTPAKFHYIFNLRDLSRIFQGVFMCDSDAGKCAKYGFTLKTDIMLLGLWKHECERVFADRLVDSIDKGWFDKTINKLLEDQFGPSKAGALKDSMFFVDFLRDGDEDPETGEELAPPQIYEPVDSLASCRERVKMFCGRFNELYKLNAVDMDDDIAWHVCERGHELPGGASGKVSRRSSFADILLRRVHAQYKQAPRNRREGGVERGALVKGANALAAQHRLACIEEATVLRSARC